MKKESVVLLGPKFQNFKIWEGNVLSWADVLHWNLWKLELEC